MRQHVAQMLLLNLALSVGAADTEIGDPRQGVQGVRPAEHLGDQGTQARLVRGGRGAAGQGALGASSGRNAAGGAGPDAGPGVGEVGHRQPGPVQLAVGREGQGVEDHHDRRNHRVRQHLAQRGPQALRAGGVAR
ncbi:MAG: hypothetical protein KY393_03550, partial [Actinobacteria bacterium]|nr:hypothetical protein [Actinomycetota bacterium]